MARLTVTLDVPEWTVEMLQRAVHDIDELDSGEGDGIAPENVKAWDVMQFIVLGQLGFIEIAVDMTALGLNIKTAATMHIVTNTMED